MIVMHSLRLSLLFCIYVLCFVKQGVAVTGRNSTGPPCSVGYPSIYSPGGRPARPPASLQTTTDGVDRRRRQTTDTIEQNNTAQLCGTIIKCKYVSGNWPISTHADPTSRDILQRCVWPERLPIYQLILGFWGSNVHKNRRFPDEPPCKIWRRLLYPRRRNP